MANPLYPPPPPHFRLYRDDADGSAERTLPPLPPPPPTGTYQAFGELHTAEDGLAPLHVRQLFETRPDGSIDFRGQLLALHAQLQAAFLDLLSVLVDRPSGYARALEAVGLVLRNMQFLANRLRPVQARAALASLLRAHAGAAQRGAAEVELASGAADAALAGVAARVGAAAAEAFQGAGANGE